MRVAALAASVASASCWALSANPAAAAASSSSALASPLLSTSAVFRAPLVTMMAEAARDEIDGWGGGADGGTFFATLDGRDDTGISPEGVMPPGEDLIEKDLRRLFDLDGEDPILLGSEAEELQVCGITVCCPRLALPPGFARPSSPTVAKA